MTLSSWAAILSSMQVCVTAGRALKQSSPDYFLGDFKMLRFSANLSMLFNEVDFF